MIHGRFMLFRFLFANGLGCKIALQFSWRILTAVRAAYWSDQAWGPDHGPTMVRPRSGLTGSSSLRGLEEEAIKPDRGETSSSSMPLPKGKEGKPNQDHRPSMVRSDHPFFSGRRRGRGGRTVVRTTVRPPLLLRKAKKKRWSDRTVVRLWSWFGLPSSPFRRRRTRPGPDQDHRPGTTLSP